MTEQAQGVVPAENGPSPWAALVLGADPDAASALIAGLSVPRRRLSATALQALQEPLEGPDVTLDDDLELRLRVAFPQADNEAGVPAHSWTPVDLSAVEFAVPTPPTIGGLAYPGRRHVYFGEPETLKTWAAAVLAVEQVREGRAVVLVDAENGPGMMLERLRNLGLTDEELGRVAYIAPAEPLVDAAVIADVDSLLVRRRPSLVVIDSFDALLDLHELDSHSSTDVERFYRTVAARFQAQGAAVILLDHVTKDPGKRGRFAIGSQRKIGAADVALGFELVRPFGRGRSGLARIIVHKDRPGYLPRPRAAELELTSDAETGQVTWGLRSSEAADDGDDFRPTTLMERVSRFVEAHVEEETPTRSNIEEAVTGKGAYVRQAIDVLVREGFLEESPGARGARLLSSVRPYREADE